MGRRGPRQPQGTQDGRGTLLQIHVLPDAMAESVVAPAALTRRDSIPIDEPV